MARLPDNCDAVKCKCILHLSNFRIKRNYSKKVMDLTLSEMRSTPLKTLLRNFCEKFWSAPVGINVTRTFCFSELSSQKTRLKRTFEKTKSVFYMTCSGVSRSCQKIYVSF